jgi:hypothetical protein
MPRPNNIWIALLIIISSLLGFTIPAITHKVKVSNQVGATLHIEPTDQARANEPTVIWFALTKKGGQIIPLRQCDCQLQVFKLPGKKAILQPTLRSINAEKYQGIPSAQVLFKDPGVYRLALSGQPQDDLNFEPFQLQFEITVAPGRANSK